MGRFELHTGQDGHVLVCDTESGYEAELVLLGVFTSPAHRMEYAEALVQALNGAAIPTRELSQYDSSGRLKAGCEASPDDSLSAYAKQSARLRSIS